MASGRPEADTKEEPGRVSKKLRKRGGKGVGNQQEICISEQQVPLVRLIRTEPKREIEASSFVQLSKIAKASQLQISEDRMAVTGHKGFRSVRATHGVPGTGTFYCEFKIVHLGATGHARLGWCTKKAELQAPVGFDTHGYGFRDVDGSKVHEGRREAYGAPFKEGDIVGALIHLPEGGRPIEAREKKVVRYKGAMYIEDEPDPTPHTLVGSFIAFSVNGVPQGRAFSDIMEGTYYPAISLYTMPGQAEGATVAVNFGPVFAFPPAFDESVPPALPVSSLAEVPAAMVAAVAPAAAATVTAAC